MFKPSNQSRGFESSKGSSQNEEDLLQRKRKMQGDKENKENKENVEPPKKKFKPKDFTRPVSGPLSDITNGPLESVSRKRTRSGAFEVDPDNKENIHQHDNNSKKRRLGELLKENPQSSKDHDWGFTKAFQNRNLVNPDRQRPDDSDRSLERPERKDVSADGNLDLSQQKRGVETIQRAMHIEHKSADDLKEAGVDPKAYREARQELHDYLANDLAGEKVSIEGYEKTRRELNSMVAKLEEASKGSHEAGTPASEHKLTKFPNDSGVSINSRYEPSHKETRNKFTSETRGEPINGEDYSQVREMVEEEHTGSILEKLKKTGKAPDNKSGPKS